MSISEKCLEHYNNFFLAYQRNGEADTEYQKICLHLEVIQQQLVSQPDKYDDQTLVSSLAISGASLQDKNPQLRVAVDKFLRQYNEQPKTYTASSRPLLSFVDPKGTLLDEVTLSKPPVATRQKPYVRSFFPTDSQFNQEIERKADEFSLRRRYTF